MELPSYFADFLSEIRLTKSQIDHCKTGHRVLRERLQQDERLAPVIVSTFLQGSYRRATAVRPYEDKRADVDVIVVTKLSQNEYPDPEKAIQTFAPFVRKHYKDKYEIQGRSIGIHLSYVDLDLVITSAPSESEFGVFKSESVVTDDTLEEARDWRLVKSWLALDNRLAESAKALLEASKKESEWKPAPLYIPDREAKCWEPTHPLEQIRWTRDKNERCNGHYVNVVRAIKWWRRIKHPTPKYPKGYPVEHLVGDCCPDGITSIAVGITLTLETMAHQYESYAVRKQTPFLPDRGVPQHNVFRRVSGEDFATFHSQVCGAAKAARIALDSVDLQKSVKGWKELLGDKFPDPPPSEGDDDGGDDPKKGGYTPRRESSEIGAGRFA